MPPVGAQLLSTKLYVPSIRHDAQRVRRPRLIERLDAALRRKLTLVSAPAGFGKTMLVSEWVSGKAGTAWISLDVEDNDPARFWRYVIAALQPICPKMETTLRVLGVQPDATDALLTSLINDVAAAPGDRDLVLVLDDYHLIESEPVHEGIEYLLDHLPPALHLVITTREDPPLPLSRLRGRGQLAEIRAVDLRFTPQETADFLNAAMGLDLSADEVAALERRTEGWIVGLQMAALSLRGQSGAERQCFVRAFAGDDRYVANYLIDEVLRGQPPHVQRFLIETSVLDRLCGPLCDAILGQGAEDVAEPTGEEALRSYSGHALIDRYASPSQAILERLFESNLFLVSLDGRGHWFRYHRLFGDLLLSRLQESAPERVALNHTRASVWYEGQGAVPEAISHALKAGDHERTAYLVERYGGQVFQRGASLRAIGRWLDALPDDMVRSRPILCMARAWTLVLALDAPERATYWIERALDLSAANPQPLIDPDSAYRTDREVIVANARMIRLTIVRREAAPDEVIAPCLETLAALPEEEAFGRGLVNLWLAEAYGRSGDVDAAVGALAQAKQLGLAVEGHVVALAAAGFQAQHAWERGDLHAVARICRETIDTLIRPAEQAGERLPAACYAYVLLGRTLLEWSQVEEAEPLLFRGVELAGEIPEPAMQIDGSRDLARLHWVQGHYQQAHAWMDRALQACPWDPDYLHALRARIWLAQAEEDPRWLDMAVRWANGRTLEAPDEYSWAFQSLVRVRIAQYRACRAPDLGSVLDAIDEHERKAGLVSSGSQVEVLTLKALLLHALGRTEEALQPLARALAVAEATGRVWSFLEHRAPMVALLREAVRQDFAARYARYARQLLGAFEAMERAGEDRPAPGETPPTQAGLVEPLSERELEVLRLLATTLSGPAIADQLSISLSTFRSHTKSIYGKLDVHSRLDAVARATALGLLADRG